ncbi:hypothetical protein A2U01_0037812, partial [Trifolium medium]|nr:hypothetical protein [Trifolium medium]
ICEGEDVCARDDTAGVINRSEQSGQRAVCQTPSSGINLISGSVNSKGTGSMANDDTGEREKLLEAAKLFSIQKEVGFSFDELDGATLKQFMDQERNDRAKKMEREQRVGDQ